MSEQVVLHHSLPPAGATTLHGTVVGISATKVGTMGTELCACATASMTAAVKNKRCVAIL